MPPEPTWFSEIVISLSQCFGLFYTQFCVHPTEQSISPYLPPFSNLHSYGIQLEFEDPPKMDITDRNRDGGL